ncbi:IS66 family insertion sequence element accessory protein TnpB [Desulfobacter postgatei]|uniref:IS66 Orf2 like protein n=1 Tax=Desulfobacter postgatei 2ac9 TaxID=879212 RepID=I5B4T7_9BACT|nr:IS66 family insertion sequence element accessory protein TnpB [Desulfobacter postgatei]EIM64500.1 IS66 Orf2 like protein [Desulfobacter postgatei 2ac9]
MFSPTQNLKIHIALGSTDMGKSIDGLSVLVSETLNLDPFSGHMFGNTAKPTFKVIFVFIGILIA